MRIHADHQPYEQLEKEIEIALSDKARGFLFHVNSPGGMASGNIETAGIISAIPVPKAVWVDDLGTCASYALAAGADFIATSPSSQEVSDQDGVGEPFSDQITVGVVEINADHAHFVAASEAAEEAGQFGAAAFSDLEDLVPAAGRRRW